MRAVVLFQLNKVPVDILNHLEAFLHVPEEHVSRFRLIPEIEGLHYGPNQLEASMLWLTLRYQSARFRALDWDDQMGYWEAYCWPIGLG